LLQVSLSMLGCRPLILLPLLAMLLPMAARADSCDATVAAAHVLRFHTANTTVHTSEVDGRPGFTYQSIAVDGKEYVETGDRHWQVTAWDAEADVAYFKANNVWTDCRPDGSDSVAGEAALVYVSRTTVAGAEAQVRNWISQASGLPLRLQIGVKKFGMELVQLSDYGYRGVVAPDVNLPAPSTEAPVPEATETPPPDEGTCRHNHTLYDRLFGGKESCKPAGAQ
jgi:hypothetical protein